MVLNHRVLSLALLIGVIIVLNPNLCASAQSHINGIPAGNLFHEYSNQFFLDRSIQFTKDMYLRESYLTGITWTAVKEIKARRKDRTLKPSDLSNHAWSDLPSFHPFDPNRYKDRRISRAYPAWEKSQLEEFFRSMLQIEEIRDQLIASAAPGQKLRMFQEEYTLALKAYANQQWELAILRFDGLLDAYRYRMVDDILFYRSEACLELEYRYQAFVGYYQVIQNHVESTYWEDSMVRAITILYDLGLTERMKNVYEKWESRIARSNTSTQDMINYKMAQICFLEQDFDQTIYHTTLMSPTAENRTEADILLASAWALKGDYTKAIPTLNGMLNDRKVDRELKDDAAIKLAAIYFEMEEYEQILEVLDPIQTTSSNYPIALLLQAWAEFRLNNLRNAVELTGRLLDYFPSNETAYEAACLEAYSQQTPVAPEVGKDIFQTVMDDAVCSWKLESAFQEREKLFMNLQETIGLEEKVFIGGRRDLFERYVETRSHLNTLLRRLQVYEMHETNIALRPVLDEQLEVARVARVLYDLSESVKGSYTTSKLHAFLGVQDNLADLNHRLITLTKMLSLRNPPFIQEYENRFARSFSTWLISKTNAELDQMNRDLNSISSLDNQSRELKEYAARFRLEQERRQLDASLDELDMQRTELGSVELIGPTTHLEEWAEFSFRRTFLSGGLLSRYSFSQTRIGDLNRYINTINQLLSDEESTPTEAIPNESGVNSPNE